MQLAEARLQVAKEEFSRIAGTAHFRAARGVFQVSTVLRQSRAMPSEPATTVRSFEEADSRLGCASSRSASPSLMSNPSMTMRHTAQNNSHLR